MDVKDDDMNFDPAEMRGSSGDENNMLGEENYNPNPEAIQFEILLQEELARRRVVEMMALQSESGVSSFQEEYRQRRSSPLKPTPRSPLVMTSTPVSRRSRVFAPGDLRLDSVSPPSFVFSTPPSSVNLPSGDFSQEDEEDDNEFLLQELEERDLTIQRLKSQLRAVLELSGDNNESNRSMDNLRHMSQSRRSSHSSGNSSQLNENGAVMFSHRNNMSLSIVEELEEHDGQMTLFSRATEHIRFLEVDPEVFKTKLISGSVITRDLAIGGTLGWLAGLLFRKFGKMAVTAVGGGVLLLKLATHRGYIVINWGEIYDELRKKSEEDVVSGEKEDWATEKFHKIKAWGQERAYVVTGAVAGFMYQLVM